MKRLFVLTAVGAILLAEAALAKPGDFFARQERGRVYARTGEFGQVTRWRDQACKSTFEHRSDSSGRLVKWTIDWKRMFSVRPNTKSNIIDDAHAALYETERSVVLDGQAAFQGVLPDGATVSANNFEFFLKDQARLDALITDMKATKDGC